MRVRGVEMNRLLHSDAEICMLLFMKKKVIITVGGTGGHVFPALTLAKQLFDLEILFVGGGLEKNRYFEGNAYSFHEIACGPLPLKKPLVATRNIFKISKGIWQSRQIIQSFKPHLMIGFGSYYTLPTLLAGKICGIPIVLHEANRIPGKVNRLLAPFAAITGINFSDTKKYLKGNVTEVPVPLREGYKKGAISKEEARKHFNLSADKFTLLIFGGSQGAQKVNQLVSQAICEMQNSNLQVLQFTGNADSVVQLCNRYKKAGISCCVKEFESRMDIAWQAADLAVVRSGASTLAEQLEFEIPAIFIPYPYATDNHQESNANFMEDEVQGAIMRRESDLTSEKLKEDLYKLLADDFARINEMMTALRNYKIRNKPKQLQTIVRELLIKLT